jgi:Fur family ferric uptake transcriptional regulator
MPTYTASALKADLHERGGRMTTQRKTILKVFQNLSEGRHLSAEDLCELLKSEGKAIGMSTIYRNLKLMSRLGILRELELAEDQKRYEINRPWPHHHHHIICVQCNRTVEFKDDSVLKLCMTTAKESGYRVLDCQLSIHAICSNCQRSVFP